MPAQTSYFRQFDKSPNTSEGHIWADYIEILCFVDQRQEISIDYLLDRFNEGADVEDFSDFEDELEEGIDEFDLGYSHASQRNENLVRKIEDWFSILEYRKAVFGSYYPFEFSEDQATLIRISDEALSDKHILYLNLLLASNLRHIHFNSMRWLTDGFELISWETLKHSMPSFAEVHLFSSKHGEIGRYPGNTRKKLRKLGEDLGEEVASDLSFIDERSTGDRGLDIVAWIPLGDKLQNRVVVFAQCACSPEEWKKKRQSVHSDFWRRRIYFQVQPIPAMFIPHCYRNAQGGWENEDYTTAVAMFDRQRIIWMLDQHPLKILNDLSSQELIGKFLEHRLDIF